MRYSELKNLDDFVALEMIFECETCRIKDIVEKTEQFEGKIVLFLGNFDQFDTPRLCARIFEYIPTEKKWKVGDIIVNELSGTWFWKHFTSQEVKENFAYDLRKKMGFVIGV